MKLIKNKDEYYERIVTWDNEPNRFYYVLGWSIAVLDACSFLILISNDSSVLEGVPTLLRINLLLGYMLGILFIAFLSLVLILQNKGENKQVKFKKIK